MEYGSTWQANTNQITTYDGEQQKKEITFKLKCEASGGGTGGSSSMELKFQINGGQSSTTQTYGTAGKITLEIVTNGAHIDDVKLKEGKTMKATPWECLDDCDGTTLYYEIDDYTDWTTATYRAVVTSGSTDYESLGVAVTETTGAGPSGDPATDPGKDDPEPPTVIHYCDGGWGTVTRCYGKPFKLYRSNFNYGTEEATIQCIKKGESSPMGEDKYKPSTTDPDWGETYKSCIRGLFSIST